MALTPPSPYLLYFPLHSSCATTHRLLFSDLASSSSFFRSPWAPSHKSKASAISPIVIKEASSFRVKCTSKSTAEEDLLIERDALDTSGNGDDPKAPHQSSVPTTEPIGPQRVSTSLSDSLSLGIREPVYEVLFLPAFFFSFASPLFNPMPFILRVEKLRV